LSISNVALTRRQFLARTARLAAGAGLGLSALSSIGCGGGSTSSSISSNSAWRELARRISGPVLRPGDPGFKATALPNNLRYASILPQGIAKCANANDVAQAILWSQENDIALITRSGGHSYAGFSTTHGLMIDMTLINQAQFAASTGIVTIGGGIRNVDLYSALQAADATITHGRCIGVGGAGFLLGGGIGFNMRRYGLACDQVSSCELVTANGQILTLSATENPDLFWACCGGGGGNFGINTSFSLQTMPADDLITVFEIIWSGQSDATYAALIDALQDAPPTMGNRVGASAVTPAQLARGQDVTITLLGQLAGTPAELADILAPVYQVAAPLSADIRQLTYWDAQLNFLDEPGPPDRYQERSSFFGAPPGAEAIESAFTFLRAWPGTSESASFVLFQTGAQVNAVAPAATAFVHRDSDWLMTMALHWGAHDSRSIVQNNLEWQAGFYEAMRNFSSGAYVNFPDPSLTTWQQDYYGANLPRLESIKAQVDPLQVFHFAQSIPPATTMARRSNLREALYASARRVRARAA
jgi:FAD/FMN-containing dehydrogenase